METTTSPVRGERLHQDVATSPAPASMLVRLPRVEGCEWVRVGKRLVLAEFGTRIVRRVIADVFD